MKQDNERALGCLIKRYQPVLFRRLLNRTQSTADAQEILQDIFISLWNKRHTVSTEVTIYPYLFSAAKYELVDWYVKTERKNYRETVHLTSDSQVVFPAEDFLMAGELREMLRAEVAKMPLTMKTVFRLSREELLSVKEIAQSLSLSEQTVKNNITAALKRIRHLLKAER